MARIHYAMFLGLEAASLARHAFQVCCFVQCAHSAEIARFDFALMQSEAHAKGDLYMWEKHTL